MMLRRYHHKQKLKVAKPAVDYHALTVPELKALAKKRGIDFKANVKKNQLINLLEKG